MRLFLLVCLVLSGCCACAQSQSNAIVGFVFENETNLPVIGAVVSLYQDTVAIQHRVTNVDGEFAFGPLAIGRYAIAVRMLGFQSYSASAIQVTSGKSITLHIPLLDDLVLAQEVVVKANARESSINEMASVSAKQFDVQETDRYAGSRGDPARMASNFAGVVGADDSRNDIVIRGNSPQSVLWRIEGLDLPNPNHFNIPGTAGGPVSIINNKYLGNSDFYTGAFPAEYGNSTAGAFDLKMRNGDARHLHGSGQFGFLGTEIFLEGPMIAAAKRDSSLRKPSFLVNYRYSTVQLFSLLGIDIGTDAVPKYQDAAFRLNWPLKNNNNLALWGIAGKSSVDILISDQTSPDQRNIYGQNDRDQYFDAQMAVIGCSWNKSIGQRTSIKSNSAWMHDGVFAHHDLVYRRLVQNQYVVDSLQPILAYAFNQNKWTNHTSVQTKFNAHWILRVGVTSHGHRWSHLDSTFIRSNSSWLRRWNTTIGAIQCQPYAQIKWKPNTKWAIVAGLHAHALWLMSPSPIVADTLDYSLNPQHFSGSLEPRMSIRYDYAKNAHFAFGCGRHSQSQSPYIYSYLLANNQNLVGNWNSQLGFTYSNHYVLSWQYMPLPQLRLLCEAYYQKLSGIPIDVSPSSFSLANSGAGFSRIFPGVLTNAGTGQNRGVECTVEQFFRKGWLWLISASLFKATYSGSDGVLRNADFNNRFALNALVSKEWLVANKTFVVVGSKVTFTGGRWYGPADIEASNAANELIFDDQLRNSLQFKNYFRWDLKINVKRNNAKTMHEIGLDLVNLLNTKNVLALTYAPDENNDPQQAIRQEYQLGFLPLFYYKIDF